MKKNLIFGILLVSVLMISLVSAGITGGVISGKLIRGETAAAGDVNVKVLDVSRSGVASVQVTNPETKAVETVAIKSDGSALTSFGKVQVGAVTPSSLFRKANVENIVVTPAKTQVVTSQNAEECSANCQAFTERYKLDEGETISIGSDTLMISFIDEDSVKFEVNGQPTELFSKNQWFELSNSQIVEVENIRKLGVPGTIGWTALGLNGYKLDEGETINLQGNQISINYIDANSVKLEVNNQLTDLLNKGGWVELNSGQIAVVEKINKLEVGGTIGYVRIGLASCYFPYL